MTDFEVTSSGPDRVRVEWEDAEAGYYFLAKVDGDEIVEITKGMRPFPTVFRVERGLGGVSRGSTKYFSANEAAFAPIVAEARERIRIDKLASAAMDARRAERAEMAARIVVEKAAAVRKKLAERKLPTFPEVSDAMLADLYDAIQNAAV